MTSLLDHYLKYHKERTDASTEFGAVMFLHLMGGLLGPQCHNNLTPRIVHHNSYVALIGMSSRSRKSTAQDLCRWFAPEDMDLPDNMSPERFLEDLESKPHCFWWYGEWSKMLKRMDSRHYLSDIIEYLNEIYDCPANYKRNIKEKEVHIKYPHLSFSTTCTEEVLIKHTSDEMVDGGFFARFVLVEGDSQGDKRKILTKEAKEHAGKIQSVINAFIRNNTFYQQTGFILTEKALDVHHEIEEEMYDMPHVGSFAGRYSNHIIKFADVLLLCDVLGSHFDNPNVINNAKSLKSLFSLGEDGNIMVGPEYVRRAWEILKPCLLYTSKLVTMVKSDKVVRRLKHVLEKNGSMTYSDAMNLSNLNKNQMKLAIDTMEQNGEINLDEEITRATTNREYRKIKIVPRWGL